MNDDRNMLRRANWRIRKEAGIPAPLMHPWPRQDVGAGLFLFAIALAVVLIVGALL